MVAVITIDSDSSDEEALPPPIRPRPPPPSAPSARPRPSQIPSTGASTSTSASNSRPQPSASSTVCQNAVRRTSNASTQGAGSKDDPLVIESTDDDSEDDLPVPYNPKKALAESQARRASASSSGSGSSPVHPSLPTPKKRSINRRVVPESDSPEPRRPSDSRRADSTASKRASLSSRSASSTTPQPIKAKSTRPVSSHSSSRSPASTTSPDHQSRAAPLARLSDNSDGDDDDEVVLAKSPAKRKGRKLPDSESSASPETTRVSPRKLYDSPVAEDEETRARQAAELLEDSQTSSIFIEEGVAAGEVSGGEMMDEDEEEELRDERATVTRTTVVVKPTADEAMISASDNDDDHETDQLAADDDGSSPEADSDDEVEQALQPKFTAAEKGKGRALPSPSPPPAQRVSLVVVANRPTSDEEDQVRVLAPQLSASNVGTGTQTQPGSALEDSLMGPPPPRPRPLTIARKSSGGQPPRSISNSLPSSALSTSTTASAPVAVADAAARPGKARKSTGGRPLPSQQQQPIAISDDDDNSESDAGSSDSSILEFVPTPKRFVARKSAGGRAPAPKSHATTSKRPLSPVVEPGAKRARSEQPEEMVISSSSEEDDEEEEESDKTPNAQMEVDSTVTATAKLTSVLVPGVDGGEARVQQHVALDIQASSPARPSQESLAFPRTSASPNKALHFSLTDKEPFASVSMSADAAERLPMVVDVNEDDAGAESLLLNADLSTGKVTQPAMQQDDGTIINEHLAWQQSQSPWNRLISGPTWEGEFDTSTQDFVNWSDKLRRRLNSPDELTGYNDLAQAYQSMIFEANTAEIHPQDRPKVRVLRPPYPITVKDQDGNITTSNDSAPAFEFNYTSRIVYVDGIAPKQAPGCDCEGDCASSENYATCACRLRQVQASKTKSEDQRSDHDGFAYTSEGVLVDVMQDKDEPIIECNSECGCSKTCSNSIIGRRRSVSVDIFHTGACGWGVRNPPSYDDPALGYHHARVIKKGTPLAIYSGELLLTADAYKRDDLMYSDLGRNYIYDIDNWCIGEDLKAQIAVQQALTVSAKTTVDKKKKKGKGKQKQVVVQAPVEDEGYKAVYAIDAFHVGNWTRFANHRCDNFNAAVRTVHVDEDEVTRPLLVFFAVEDIPVGEEITISYFGRKPELGLQNKTEYKKAANKRRKMAPKEHQCYCNQPLCRGVMFNPDLNNEEDDDEEEEE